MSHYPKPSDFLLHGLLGGDWASECAKATRDQGLGCQHSENCLFGKTRFSLRKLHWFFRPGFSEIVSGSGERSGMHSGWVYMYSIIMAFVHLTHRLPTASYETTWPARCSVMLF